MIRLRASLLFLASALTSTVAAAANADVNTTANAGDDFYDYANGAWVKATPLSDGASKLDTTSILRTQNARRVSDLIGRAVRASSAGGRGVRSDVKKIADYYLSQLDIAAIEAKGLAPLAGDLAAIAAITDRRALAAWLGHTIRLDDGSNQQTESLWGVWFHQGFHDSDHYSVHFVQGGLGLAGKEDYFDHGAEAAARRAAYEEHVRNVLRLAGFDNPDMRAARVLELETSIAATHASRAETDDVFKTDNSWQRADFAAKAPGVDWPRYFSASALDRADSFVVWQPKAVAGGAKLVATYSLDSWKDYCAFHLIEHYAGAISPSLVDRPVATALEPQAIAATEAALGDAIGRLYVERYFPARDKAAAEAMVENLRIAFRARLANLAWMSPTTKKKARAKLAALKVGVGYPEAWIEYATLVVVRGDAVGNLRRAEGFTYAHERAKLDRTVDVEEWAGQLHPQMVGAILNISPNSMEFTAGLLQPPYFDARGDVAANYGSAGAGIAHEISHSFDELGNKYDARGRLGLWWTTTDLARYRDSSSRLARQLDACSPQPGLFADGNQILAESASDLGGLVVAFDAYHLLLRGRTDVIKNGLTGDQRFFLAFARRWRRVQTEDALRAQIKADTHAPPRCRSNLVRNADAWVRAFQVKPSDKLYLEPRARARIW